MKYLRLLPILLILLIPVCFSACKEKEAVAQVSSTPLIITAPTAMPTSTPAFTPPPDPTPLTFPTMGYCNGEGVNVRAEANKNADVIDIMGENVVLNVISLQDGWYRINLDGQTGYIAETLVTIGDPPRKDNVHWAKVAASSANLYKSPSTAEPSGVKLKKGDVLKVLRKINDYLHVVYNGNLQRYIKVSDVEYITEAEFKGGTPPPKTATPPPKTATPAP